jgi:hypothetical protein
MKILQTFESDEYNALLTALYNAAEAEYNLEGSEKVYKYLEEIPKTSLVVELTGELHRLGFKIVKTK